MTGVTPGRGAPASQPEKAVGAAPIAFGRINTAVTHVKTADRNPVAAESANTHGRTVERIIGEPVRTGHAVLPELGLSGVL